MATATQRTCKNAHAFRPVYRVALQIFGQIVGCILAPIYLVVIVIQLGSILITPPSHAVASVFVWAGFFFEYCLHDWNKASFLFPSAFPLEFFRR